ncbi:DUF6541 family protein [Knoellia sp. Soil729]|uniref:DUF6541 family protein n=1 Tax=Knoellia sp. Soil729 TaxID=1736394 RepID=UPI0006FF739D|nr:DUF6541 family protein [Knoellia sp. Soil729]KRE43740.1 hypothetical protein ASG74_02555 [Knoellia sp. Soil729]
MIEAQPVGWLSAVPVLLACVLLVLGPGAATLRLARFPLLVVAGAAAPLTVSVLVVAGLAAGQVGLPWTAATLAGVVVLMLAAGFAVGRLRRSTAVSPLPRPKAAWVGASVVLAALVGALPAMVTMGDAGAIPQQPDTIFHLGTIRSMLDLRDISTLHALGFATPGGSGFYPAGFHAVAATLVDLTGASVTVAANAVAIVSGFLVWPLAMTLLAGVAFGSRTSVLVPAPFAAVVFSTFPTWFLGYGVLWPNLLGQAILPATVALGVRLLRAERSWSELALLVILLPGLTISHPNALFAFVVAAVVVVVCAAIAYAVRPGVAARRRLAALVAAAVCTGGAAAAWLLGGMLSPSMRASNPLGPEATLSEAVIDVAFSAARWQRPLWVLGIVTLAGAVVLVVRRRGGWVLLLSAVCAVLYVLSVVVDSPLVRWVTWPWYNNSPRLASLLVLPLALLVVAALSHAARVVAQHLRPSVRPLVPAALVLVLLATTVGGNAAARVMALDGYYDPEPSQSWISRAELRSLTVLGQKIPDGSVVAANPWSGGNWLALVSDERMLYPTEKVLSGSRDLIVLGKHLDEVASDPEVCRLARERQVDYAITGGRVATKTKASRSAYSGVEGVGDAKAWEEVAESGPYRLYRLTGCQTR